MELLGTQCRVNSGGVSGAEVSLVSRQRYSTIGIVSTVGTLVGKLSENGAQRLKFEPHQNSILSKHTPQRTRVDNLTLRWVTKNNHIQQRTYRLRSELASTSQVGTTVQTECNALYVYRQ